MSEPVRIGDATLYLGDALAVLRELPDESVHCVVTSPPYWGLRDYGVDGQIGLEETPEQYVAKMVEVFREVRRLLRKDGTCWVNLGDSYAGSGKGPSNSLNKNNPHSHEAALAMRGMNPLEGTPTSWLSVPPGMKAKDLVGIPWMVAFALRFDGWYLRSDIIWSKPNPMPESCTDRPTKAHEYLFLLSKSARYFYDAEVVREGITEQTAKDRVDTGRFQPDRNYPGATDHGNGRLGDNPGGKRNRRTVWTIATEPYPEAHFATFPRKLVQPCILAGCPEHACPKCGAPWVKEVERGELVSTNGTRDGYRPPKATDDPKIKGRSDGWTPNHMRPSTVTGEHPTCTCGLPAIGGTVLDPFGGSGTTAEVALEYGRRAILIELKPEYVELQKRRLAPVAGRPLLNYAEEKREGELFTAAARWE